MTDHPAPDRAARPPRAALVSALLGLCAALSACGGAAPSGGTPDPSGPPLQPQTAWTPLLNGTDLSGWTTWFPSQGAGHDPERVFQVEDGALHVLNVPVTAQDRDFGYVATTTPHADYRLRLQYRWGSKTFAPRREQPRDAGVLYHMTGPDGLWPSSLEFQIMEGSTGDLWALNGTNLSTTAGTNAGGELRYDPFGEAVTTTFPAQSYKRLERAAEVPEAAGWNDMELIVSGDEAVQVVDGQVTARVTGLRAPNGSPLTAGRIALQAEGAEVYYRNIDVRPLAYLPPPAGATVLLGPGATSADGWQARSGAPADWPVQGGVMTVRSTAVPGDAASSNDVRTAQEFGDMHVHLEFKLPVTRPGVPEQDRANSGVYLQGRYEVQILDSFGTALGGRDDLGAVYGQRDAASNEALPAGTWQTYDILFRAARWQGGEKAQDARMTVYLNGEKVQDDVPVSGSTLLGAPEADADGPLVLQDHGSAVQFRNIWAAPLDGGS
ncbi:hypothetical protein HNQ07_003330 [Deinococcus metalli]|uniref:3-keto-alpha-glucoside-1,2-lyase/3-keto-2-hydroxy-glucal hydratase domain-containing protein n=1 Tax=Deinococcus metalli TaxID=1141878 RepID=A0A7W8KGT1_9DEIO|nr:DUF1080 domain-containing protein [Deinococcus metalli]MBB5377830.1 hypothetical protein [Deinococcus metalli]GHF55626.1 hypothetical protein GCM10017781_35030 [Deinococcus metalli]